MPEFAQFRRGCVTEKPEIAEAGAEPAPGVDPAALAVALGAAGCVRATTLERNWSEKSGLARFSHV